MRNHTFDIAPEQMDERIRKPVTLAEFAVMLLAFGIGCLFVVIDHNPAFTGQMFPDFRVFLQTAQGNYGGFFYGFWSLPVFNILDALPLSIAFLLWTILNILGVWFAARVFNGRPVLAIISYQMLYVVFYGNIVGVIVGALAVLWYSLHKGWLWLAGLAFIVACIKVQLGGPLALVMLAIAPLSWRDKSRVLIIPVVVVILSFVFYGNWIMTVLDWAQRVPPNSEGSIALWRWFGLGTLVLWVPPLLLPMTKGQRLVMMTAALALATPYFQQTDLIALFVLPVAWLPLLGNFGYIYVFAQWAGFAPMILIAVIAYVWVLYRIYKTRSQETNIVLSKSDAGA